MCKSIITTIIEASISLSIDNYAKAKILYTLRSLVMFDGKGHSENQKLILNIIQ